MVVGRVVGERLARTACRPVFLSGSVAVGLGNAASDIDIYLIEPGGVAAREQLFTEDTRFDVHYIPYPTLQAAVDRVLRSRLVAIGPAAGQSVAHADVTLAVHLHQGEIVHDDGRLAPLRERLAASSLTLRKAVINHWVLDAAGRCEDFTGLRGSVNADDQEAGLLTARAMLTAGAKAVAAAADDLHFGEKWVWHQLARSAPPGFPQEHCRQLVRADPLGGMTGLRVEDVVAFAQTCIAAAATLGWQGIPLGRWPSWRRRNGPLVRDASYAPRAYEDGIVLIGPGSRHIHLKPDVALVWSLADGVRAADIADEAGRLRDASPAYHDLQAGRCATLISQLADAGLVHEVKGAQRSGRTGAGGAWPAP
jgi:hypothetical protein